MDDLSGALIVIAILGFIALIIYWVGRGKYAEREMQFETQKQILDKIGTGPEMIKFLNSKEGIEIFERLKPPPQPSPPPKKETSAESLSYISFFICVGFIAVGLGVGWLIAAYFTPRYLVAGFVLTGGGIGLLIANWIAYRLGVKWGLIRKETAEGSGAQVS